MRMLRRAEGLPGCWHELGQQPLAALIEVVCFLFTSTDSCYYFIQVLFEFYFILSFSFISFHNSISPFNLSFN